MIIDSGAEVTVLRDPALITRKSRMITDTLLGAGDEPLHVDASGSINLQFPTQPVRIRALASKDVSCNLISLHDLEKAGLTIDLKNRAILDCKENKLADLINHGRFICLPLSLLTSYRSINNVRTKFSMAFLHRLFGHINIRSIKETISKKLIQNINLQDVDWTNYDKFQCPDCMKGKASKHKHFVGSRLKYQNDYGAFEYIHTDLFGPVSGVSAIAPLYFISFTDEATRFRWVYPLRTKSADAIYHTFDHLVRQIKTQFQVKVLSFHMDRGSEFTNSDMRDFFQNHGIIPIYTTTADSSANGVAESSNLTFLNDCRTLLSSTNLPNSLWFHAVEFATMMRNAFVNSTNKFSPRGKAGLAGLDASTILPFGQEVVVHQHSVKNKLRPRGVTGYALSPSKESHGYLIYLPSTKQIVDSSNYVRVKHDSNVTPSDQTAFDDLLSSIESPIPPEQITSTIDDDSISIIPTSDPDLGGNPISERLRPRTDSNTIFNIDSDFDEDDEIPLDALEPVDPIPEVRPPVDPIPEARPPVDPIPEASTLVDSIPEDHPPVETLPEDHPPVETLPEARPPVDPPKQAANSAVQILPSVGGRDKIDAMRNSNVSSLEIFSNRPKRTIRDRMNENYNRKDLGKTDSEYDAELPQRQKQRVKYIKAVNRLFNVKAKSPSLSYHEAITHNRSAKDREGYIKAYQKEITQLEKMFTWDTKRLYDAKDINKTQIINSMFIFTTKRDGTKKCRFVARGDQQHPSTYDPDATSNTVHQYALMSTLAEALDAKKYVTQLDISSAYLYADLTEDLYIRTPPHMSKHGKVLKLQKSLYGLKQSGSNWYQTIRQYLVDECNLKEVLGWSCVFKNNDITVCLFVDDMVVTSKSLKYSQEFIAKLRSKYDTKVVNPGKPDDQGNICYDILGLEIEYNFGNTMEIGMEKSLESKLPDLDVPLTYTGQKLKAPAQPGTIIEDKNYTTDEEEYKRDVKWLQRIIGLASYVAQKYRYDILFYVNILAKHTLYPSKQVKQLARQMVQYLWDTRSKRLCWNRSESKINNVEAITDASFSNLSNYGSQTGYLMSINGKFIGGASKRTTLTCTSSTESEICAVSSAVPIVNSMRLLMPEISNKKTQYEVKCDSMSTISTITSEEDKKFRNRFFGTKAIRIKEEIKYFDLKFNYINTELNTADILTKALSYKRFNKLTSDWIK